ncbi:hypothetical protein FRB97_006707 [Tulasnella sp. 331]|nr:hypothetical protein FRB97_006707 [Tulasnella sp. 331]
MLYSAFFLTLAAVPAFSSPVFSSHQLISRGVKYPAGYADKQLWSDSLDRIKSYINVQSQDGAPLAMVDISILMTAQSNAEHVMEEVVTFMTTLTDDVVQGGGSHVDGSEWSENWNAGVSQYNRLSKNHIEDLATKQEQIWSDMESAKWSNVFAWIEKIL